MSHYRRCVEVISQSYDVFTYAGAFALACLGVLLLAAAYTVAKQK